MYARAALTPGHNLIMSLPYRDGAVIELNPAAIFIHTDKPLLLRQPEHSEKSVAIDVMPPAIQCQVRRMEGFIIAAVTWTHSRPGHEEMPQIERVPPGIGSNFIHFLSFTFPNHQ